MNRAGRSQIVICGRGGQGIVFLTRLLGEAAGREDREVLTSETHGMAQRGGAIDSFVKIGEFSSPLVRPGRADAAIVIDPGRWNGARAYLGPSGVCFVNAQAPVDGAQSCDATATAREIGSTRLSNLVLLGFAARRAPDRFPSEAALLEAVAALAPKAAQANGEALRRGGELAAERGGSRARP